ncbi:MAG: hypothetical protein CTY35_00315 [Methylotenera sp.]|uniref:hypothetical protein n=1 Tax=Methylotenera sp. TaxID=2051956 RepID=UPI000D40D730|nr:hypothetical protein [Methylotenera sp.]PPC84798.1 MAG: hypothetical protein CTY38_00310 [Methylotenera sp.]PPD02158.1 MAG: hypothetical protein CTY35_00315 [Methylotenera sp.]
MPSSSDHLNKKLLSAIALGDDLNVKSLLNQGANPNQYIPSSKQDQWVICEDYNNVLHSLVCYAARKMAYDKDPFLAQRFAAITHHLIDAGADVNREILYSKDDFVDGNSRLLFLMAYLPSVEFFANTNSSMSERHNTLFQKMIDHGLDLTASTIASNNNVLHTSAYSMNASRIAWLYSFRGFREAFSGGAINATNEKGHTPLDCLIDNAAYFNCKQSVLGSVELYVRNGAVLTEFSKKVLTEDHKVTYTGGHNDPDIMRDILACVLSHSMESDHQIPKKPVKFRL